MSKLILERGNFADFTSISNVFLDEYMPKANGEFIKIYLHLLRLVNGIVQDYSDDDLSITNIADKFNMLETDVNRALHYWADQSLITLSSDNIGNITGVRFESLNRNRYFVKGISQNSNASNFETSSNMEMLATASGESISVPIPEASGIIVPAKKKYTVGELSAYAEDERFEQLTFLAQTYLGTTLNPSDIGSIIYMLDGLKLDVDFIEYLMEKYISEGHKLSYIEKKAVEFAENEIYTIEDAKMHEKIRKSLYKSIYKIFGLTYKTPVKREVLYISKWTDKYGFSDEIILEACNRTMAHTHNASFNYTDRILTNWFDNNAACLADIEALDKLHSEETAKAFRQAASTPSKKSVKTRKAKSFEQRTYDYSQLEKKILESQNQKFEKVNK